MHLIISKVKKTHCTSYLVIIFIFTSFLGCANHIQKNNSFVNADQANHPAAAVFIAYTNEVKSGSKSRDLIKFYPPKDRKRISELLGWSRLVYTSAYKALGKGNCKTIFLKSISRNRSQLDCIGTYNYKHLLSDHITQAPMHLRVYLTKNNHKWFMEKAGLQFIDSSSLKLTTFKFGIKFKHQLDNLN